MLYSAAWTTHLEPLYKKMIRDRLPHQPRHIQSGNDPMFIGLNYLNALNQQSAAYVSLLAVAYDKPLLAMWNKHVFVVSRTILRAEYSLVVPQTETPGDDPLMKIKSISEYSFAEEPPAQGTAKAPKRKVKSTK